MTILFRFFFLVVGLATAVVAGDDSSSKDRAIFHSVECGWDPQCGYLLRISSFRRTYERKARATTKAVKDELLDADGTPRGTGRRWRMTHRVRKWWPWGQQCRRRCSSCGAAGGGMTPHVTKAKMVLLSIHDTCHVPRWSLPADIQTLHPRMRPSYAHKYPLLLFPHDHDRTSTLLPSWDE